MLAQLDTLNIFDQSENIQPFLSLDGHHSRMQLPFLEYINNINHPWMVCIGVPYGTHIWQVADSSQQNGIYKLTLAKAKALYLNSLPSNKQRFLPTDIIPLVNMAWKESFANVTNSQKAIRERGWGPLNYCLLDHPDLNQKLDIQPSTENNGNNNQSTININTTGPLFQTYLDKIIDQEMKNQGRRLKYKEFKEENEHREVLLEKLKKLTTTLTSGSLVSHKQFCLTDSEYLELAKRKQADNDDKNNRKEKRRIIKSTNEDNRFVVAHKKLKSGNEVLLRDDIKALLKKVKQKTDSPLKNSMKELRLQWERQKSCLLDAIPIIKIEPQTDFFLSTLLPAGTTDNQTSLSSTVLFPSEPPRAETTCTSTGTGQPINSRTKATVVAAPVSSNYGQQSPNITGASISNSTSNIYIGGNQETSESSCILLDG